MPSEMILITLLVTNSTILRTAQPMSGSIPEQATSSMRSLPVTVQVSREVCSRSHSSYMTAQTYLLWNSARENYKTALTSFQQI